MRDGIIYDCPNANCRTPIDTGKCSKACIERYNKEMGNKPMTNADRIRAMTDEELTRWLLQFVIDCAEKTTGEECEFEDGAEAELQEWLKQPAEGCIYE